MREDSEGGQEKGEVGDENEENRGRGKGEGENGKWEERCEHEDYCEEVRTRKKDEGVQRGN